MALPQDLPIRDPKAAEQTSEHTREYQASRGGYYKPEERPIPGTPKK